MQQRLLWLRQCAYGPGGGSDEASQTLTYTVTGVPAATLEYSFSRRHNGCDDRNSL